MPDPVDSSPHHSSLNPSTSPPVTTTGNKLRYSQSGLLIGVVTYFIWGSFPILMEQLEASGTWEAIAHRCLWALVVTAILVTVTRRWDQFVLLLTDKDALWRIAVAAVLIGINWTVMLYAVFTDHVAYSSLGYYINPLMFVALGVFFLGERMRRLQIFAVALATLAVGVISWGMGGIPWIALALPITFALYGLIKKNLTRVDPIAGMAMEMTVLAPIALGLLVMVEASGEGTFLRRGAEGLGLSHDLWLMSSGLWTVIPLVMFTFAAQKLPLFVTGMLQYITPTITFILSISYFGEAMSPARWVGFGLVWAALVLLSVDVLRSRRRTMPVQSAVVDAPHR